MFKIVFGLVRDDVRGQGLLSCQIPRDGDGKRRQMPRPPSTLQHFSLIAQSSNDILSFLGCGFLFQLTSSFSVWFTFVTAPRTSLCDDTSLCYGFSTVITSLNSFTNMLGCSLTNKGKNIDSHR